MCCTERTRKYSVYNDVCLVEERGRTHCEHNTTQLSPYHSLRIFGWQAARQFMNEQPLSGCFGFGSLENRCVCSALVWVYYYHYKPMARTQRKTNRECVCRVYMCIERSWEVRENFRCPSRFSVYITCFGCRRYSIGPETSCRFGRWSSVRTPLGRSQRTDLLPLWMSSWRNFIRLIDLIMIIGFLYRTDAIV